MRAGRQAERRHDRRAAVPQTLVLHSTRPNICIGTGGSLVGSSHLRAQSCREHTFGQSHARRLLGHQGRRPSRVNYRWCVCAVQTRVIRHGPAMDGACVTRNSNSRYQPR